MKSNHKSVSFIEKYETFEILMREGYPASVINQAYVYFENGSLYDFKYVDFADILRDIIQSKDLQ